MATLASPPPDDPKTLKALLAEEQAESLPEDQLLLVLEEAEQSEAAIPNRRLDKLLPWAYAIGQDLKAVA